MTAQRPTRPWWLVPRKSTAAFSVLTTPALLLHVTSFQDGFPVLFKPALLAYFEHGTCKYKAPAGIEDCTDAPRDSVPSLRYAARPQGRNVRVAHAIGFTGDTVDAARLLRMWRGTEEIVQLEDIGDMASLRGNFHLIGWLVTNYEDIPSLTYDRFAKWIRIAAQAGQLGVVAFFKQLLGLEFVKMAITNACFEKIALLPTTTVLRWFHEYGIRPNPQVVSDRIATTAIITGNKSLLEYLVTTTGFQLTEIVPPVLAVSVMMYRNKVSPRVSIRRPKDEETARVLAWAIDTHRMAFDVSVLTSLLLIRYIRSAEILLRRRTRARPPLPTRILTPAIAAALISECETIDHVLPLLKHLDQADMELLFVETFKARVRPS